MSEKNLQALVQKTNPVEMLRNSKIGAHVYPVVKAEYTNWRDEQWAWQNAAVLFNQSYHMTDMYVEGPDALKLLSDLGINTFKNFGPDKAKQYVVCNYDGYVIGDVILFGLEPNQFNLVGRPSVHNWVTFHAQTGKYDVKLRRDDRAADQKGEVTREAYRYQVQGPNAVKVMEKVLGGPVPDLKFFNMTHFKIAGKDVRVLRHGMVGQPGFELFGPWAEGELIKETIVKAGAEFGLRLVGAKAYSSNTLESGWIPSPLPAIYSGDKMKAYREWLPANSWEAIGSLGGSFYSENIEDYYLTPYDLGYGYVVKFDHDFIGREALEKISKNPPRTKVTLALNTEDVMKAMGTMFEKGGKRAKYFDFPSAVYATWPYDKVTLNGKTVGVSTWVGYSSNEGRMLTLAILDNEAAQMGQEVTFVWGENPASSKPTAEPHVQTEIRAIVSPVPYSEVARVAYRNT